MRVLIPSDDRDWIANFAEGYRRLGFDVTTGAYNFELEATQPDIVHFNWPEELTGWKPPGEKEVQRIVDRLDRWAKRSRLILSVNNLRPHRHRGHPMWHRLYTAFFERAEVIHHFSEASRRMVCAEYPSVSDRNHVVRVGFNYDRLLPTTHADPAVTRAQLGIASDDVVYLVFGTLRFWDEVSLLRDAFRRARVPNKRLLLSARYLETGPLWRQRWRRWNWALWQRGKNISRTADYVPDEEVHKIFGAADCVIVVRQTSMSSGIPCLAMTFGRMVIAPTLGGIPEYLAGSDNLLYDGTSSKSLADAMERAAGMDREAIGARNREIAQGRKWDEIIAACLAALPPRTIH